MASSRAGQLDDCTRRVRELIVRRAREAKVGPDPRAMVEGAYEAIIEAHLAGDSSDVEIVGSLAVSMRAYAETYQRLLADRPVVRGGEVVFEASEDRRRLGSFYTPPALAGHLVEKALAAGEEKPALERRICDPAAGVGAFLVEAANQLAGLMGDGQGAMDAVVRGCLYGVDIDPLAARLCRAVLATMTSGPRETFELLDRRIRVGNAIAGATPELIEGGIPPEAFVLRPGDDPKAVSVYKRRNAKERRASVLNQPASDDPDPRLSADAWSAAFVWRRHTAEMLQWDSMTQKWLEVIRTEPAALPGWMREETQRLAAEFRFFHWHLEFPEVFTPPRG